MAKKALLVSVNFITRVVVDEANEDELLNQVSNNLIAKIQNNEVSENIDNIKEDTECPYGSLDCDKC